MWSTKEEAPGGEGRSREWDHRCKGPEARSAPGGWWELPVWLGVRHRRVWETGRWVCHVAGSPRPAVEIQCESTQGPVGIHQGCAGVGGCWENK